MKEEFLHYIWRTKQFLPTDLVTTDGEPITIHHPGFYNTDAGPDFFNAKLDIGGMRWSGNVEIHLKASDWLKHGHQQDDAYDNVILHVVYESDVPLSANNGAPLPTLELNGRIEKNVLEKFERLQSDPAEIPCAARMAEVPEIERAGWIARLLLERLERKVKELQTELELNGNDWEETFYRHLARQFGMKVNAEPFHWLAVSLPYKLLARHRDNLLQTESLLFGQSGLMENADDVYARAIRREYLHLQKKYSLRPLAGHEWKFMRLRPGNFPTVRIAQLAGLLYRREQLFRHCMETDSAEELKELFNVPASGYWNTHYRFGKATKPGTKQLGAQAVNTILINTVAPFRFLYGKQKGDDALMEQAIGLLEAIRPEENRVIREWNALQVKSKSAAETQGLLELKRNYCEKKKCLDCRIGEWLLN